MPKTEWNDFKYEILEAVYSGISYKTYLIKKIAGNWPESDKDLITLCDGYYPPVYRNFGGRIKRFPDLSIREVTVYID